MVNPALATIIIEYRHKTELFQSVDHIHLEPPPTYSIGEARSSEDPWMIFKGEIKVSYTETTYHIAPSLLDDLTTNI
jgi:hypothetical protein